VILIVIPVVKIAVEGVASDRTKDISLKSRGAAQTTPAEKTHEGGAGKIWIPPQLDYCVGGKG
jgi:hypothetical protein